MIRRYPVSMPRRRRHRRDALNPEAIWRILRANAREARAARREVERQIAREREERLQAERERLQAEREREQERERFEKELKRERERFEKELEQREAERDRATERELYRIRGDGDNRWGQLIEALVEGNLKKLICDAGIPVQHVRAGLWAEMDGIKREYDLIAIGREDTMVVECKATLRAADVRKFTERMSDFRVWRSDYARPKIWGALAYLTAKGNAAREAEEAGFYCIKAVSGSARLVNSEGFEPRAF